MTTDETLIARLEECVVLLRAGALTEQRLVDILDTLKNRPAKPQDLLYLQAGSTSIASGIVGMSMIRNGEVTPDLPGPDQWPYKTVLDAIRDGWRVISFPNQALLLDESRTYGLGCEFILER
jgi:hypothetical protein